MERPLATIETLNQLSTIILDAAITVHKEMGLGLLETVYQHCMVRELRIRKISVSMMVPVPLHNKGEPLNEDYLSIF
jgi:GxxExxY protein